MQNEYKKQIETIKDKVREILRTDQRSRNNDNRLVILYWQKELKERRTNGNIEILDEETVSTLTPYKDVYNARSDIQNKEEKYLPTIPEIMIRRKIKQETIRKYYGTESKEAEETMILRYNIK